MIPTFPLFQLSRFSSLVTDLGLSGSSYLDTYNPQTGRWEQHTISSVRLVETRQRLLYRVRRSLMDGLKDDECISLREELDNQSKVIPPTQIPSPAKIAHQELAVDESRKRPATEPLDAMPPAKQQITSGHYRPVSAGPSVSSSSYPPSTPTMSTTQLNTSVTPVFSSSGYLYQPKTHHSTTTATSVSVPSYLSYPHPSTSNGPPIPYHPHPPLKRWPNDYTVSQIAKGFYTIDIMCSHTAPILPSDGSPPLPHNMTQKTAFERIFGSRYVKSTVCRHRGVWRRAPKELREEFEAYGDEDERAFWGDFVKRVEGRTVRGVAHKNAEPVQPAQHVQSVQNVQMLPGGVGKSPMQAPSLNVGMAMQNHNVRTAVGIGHVQEQPVMDSLQNPGLMTAVL